MIFNQFIGGSGGASASIFVYGQFISSDTVYATKDGQRINGVWNGSGFDISPIEEYGTWVVTATHGGTTKTVNVLIDAAEVFSVEVKYSATVTLAGAFNSTYGYVTINGTKYTAAGAHEVQIGDTVAVYVYGYSSSSRNNCKVTLNGATVQSGSGTYNYTVTGNCTITYTRGGSTYSYYYTAAITT